MAKITNRNKLERWLEGKASWAQVIACRAALQVFPRVRPHQELNEKQLISFDRMTISTLHCICISWAAQNIPTHNIRFYGSAAAFHFVAGSDDVSAYALSAASAAFNAATTVGKSYSHAAVVAFPFASAAVASDAAVWGNIENDANWLEQHPSPDQAAEELSWQPLHSERPGWFEPEWQKTRDYLLSRNQGYELWIDWFQRRIEGHKTAFDLPRDVDKKIQIRIAEQKDDFWEKGPAVVNAEIQSWIDAARTEIAKDKKPPEIPSQIPNELQTFARDGRVARLPTPPLPVDEIQEYRRRQAWQAITDALNDYIAGGEAQNWPRLNRMIARLVAAIGDNFDDLNVVGLGVQAQYLFQYALRADEYLLPDRAADLVALNIVVGQFLPQFPEWADYLQHPDTKPESSAEILLAATAVIEVLGNAVEEPVTQALQEMKNAAQDEASINDPDEPKLVIYRQRFLGGLNNTLATAAKIALDFAKPHLKELNEGAKEASKLVGKYGSLALWSAGAATLASLAAASPNFAWLSAVLEFIMKNLNK
jgi:hypothetical protein